MSELDIEALKRQVDAQQNTAFTHGVRLELPLDQVNAIIIALEDRDRLRAEIRQLVVLAPTSDPDMDGWVLAFRHHKPPSESNWHTPENYPAIAAALEDRDG